MLSALLLLCALQDAEIPVTLNLKDAVGEWTGRSRTIVVDGTCPLPDDFTLRVDFHWAWDQVMDDGALAPSDHGRQNRQVKVRDGKFQVGLLLMGAGTYRAEVSIPNVAQPTLTDAQKKALLKRDKWTFEVGLWAPALPEKWAARVPELQKLIADIRSHVGKLEAATATEDHWLDNKGTMLRAGRELVFQARAKADVEHILPATQEYVQFVTHALDKAAGSFIFRDGKLVGAGEPYKGLGFGRDGNGIWWDGLRAAMDEASRIAGREASLWCVKLLRATPEKDWPAIRKSLAKVKDLPALESLRVCSTADLKAIEEHLRAATVDAPK